ncbi:MAG: adenylosuccinate lyase [Pseudomonadota bacterium]|nr:adenylosuccinate lyase [Pseudomonadota bacterium]
MQNNELRAISPLDGRYSAKTEPLRALFSEQSLIHTRILVEIRWFEFLSEHPGIKELEPLSKTSKAYLKKLINNLDSKSAAKVKEIENTTNHDVKAVEYYLAEVFDRDEGLKKSKQFIHFACTSEDINNICYALLLKKGRDEILLPRLQLLISQLSKVATETSSLAMLSRTHGQTASPTTLGKEFANFAWRIDRQINVFYNVGVLAKINGAVGNFNAHSVAYPNIDWNDAAKSFIESLNLNFNPHTTQIEPHDWMAEYSNALARINNILIDFCRDSWGYISIGYFKQRRVEDEVGSSTMPHKVNPIDFENAEGNLGIANALLNHFSAKLPISRWQRDLSDSTVQRNFGVAIGHSILALESIMKGLGRIEFDKESIAKDLDCQWEVLAEAIQTVMRRHGVENAYEQLKELTRGSDINQMKLEKFINNLDLPESIKRQLINLSPKDYIGLAAQLANHLPNQNNN